MNECDEKRVYLFTYVCIFDMCVCACVYVPFMDAKKRTLFAYERHKIYEWNLRQWKKFSIQYDIINYYLSLWLCPYFVECVPVCTVVRSAMLRYIAATLCAWTVHTIGVYTRISIVGLFSVRFVLVFIQAKEWLLDTLISIWCWCFARFIIWTHDT